MKTRTLGIAIVAAVVIAAVAIAIATRGSSPEGSSSGQQTAAGEVEIIAAGDFAVADYAGEPLVVNFFGSWCGPCNVEAPDLAGFASANPDTQIVGIAVDDTEDDAVAFMEEYGLSFPLVIDDTSLGAEYGITGVPTTIFYDAQGQEQDRLIGASTLEQFNAGLAKAQ